jgi:hypothetical protein
VKGQLSGAAMLATSGTLLDRQELPNEEETVYATALGGAFGALGALPGPGGEMTSVVRAVPPLKPPGPSATAEAVTAEGLRVRMPVPQETPSPSMAPKEPPKISAEAAQARAVESPLGPRRNLEAHEAKPSAPELQGHTIERHVGKSEHWLRKRLETDPLLRDKPFCSSFRNEVAANRTQGRFVKQNRAEIDAWLKSGRGWKYEGSVTMDEPVGIVVERGKLGVVESQTAHVVIMRDGSAHGWHILTSFPIPK